MKQGQNVAFEIIEHTADVGIIAYGQDLKQLMENAALGMFNLMADLSTVSLKEKREVFAKVPFADREFLVLKWLKALHELKEIEKFVPSRAVVLELNDTSVRGFAEGEPIHEGIILTHEIKAVTRHMFHIVETENGWLQIQIIFDV